MRFNLDGDSDGELDFLTHKGKKIEDMDDFKDNIEDSDADLYTDKKGRLDDEMVNVLNFGGGE